jgi:hypothetical protein
MKGKGSVIPNGRGGESTRRVRNLKAMHREIEQAGGTYTLREPSEAYGAEFAHENEALRSENTISWQQTDEISET